MKNLTAKEIIKKLQLKPLDMEGGYFKISYLSKQTIHGSLRPIASAIYYLLTPENFSHLHSHDADELFHHYAGDAVTQAYINSEEELVLHKLGSNFANNEIPQCMVPAKLWQSLYYDQSDKIEFGWSLIGATVHPGFNEDSFLRANKEQAQKIVRKFPQLEKLL